MARVVSYPMIPEVRAAVARSRTVASRRTAALGRAKPLSLIGRRGERNVLGLLVTYVHEDRRAIP